jgi:hypothetical protein
MRRGVFGLYVSPIVLVMGVAWIACLLVGASGRPLRPDRAGLASVEDCDPHERVVAKAALTRL